MIKISISRWPWQGYGWFLHKTNTSPSAAMLNPSGARFGGGWRYKFGIDIAGSTVVLNLIYGIVQVKFGAKK